MRTSKITTAAIPLCMSRASDCSSVDSLRDHAQKRNKPNTGWNFLGFAVRTSLSLGLRKEFPERKTSLLQREIRRRVWWVVHTFDSGATTNLDRPILLPDVQVMDIKHVLNIHDEALTESAAALPAEVNGPTIYSGLIAQAKFHLSTNQVNQRLASPATLVPDEAMNLQKPMDEWRGSLPTYLKQPTPNQPGWLALARNRLQW